MDSRNLSTPLQHDYTDPTVELNVAQLRERKREFLVRADRIVAMTPDVPQTDSALLIREDRDR